MIIPWDQLNPFRDLEVVLCCGCFDLFTIGHLNHLKAARALGDRLFVLVTPDRYVHKGRSRPFYPEAHRVAIIDALRCVDATILNPYRTAVETIERLRPALYAKGNDYQSTLTRSLEREIAALESVGGRLVLTEAEELHTSDVVERIRS